MSLAFRARRRLGPFAYEARFEASEEVVVLFGHSGAGKSLTLQFIAGLLRPDEGQILIDGRAVFDSAAGLNLPPQDRGLGYVVQELALFPHMTAAENIAFGMPTGIDRNQRTRELLGQLGLEGFGGRKPATLSGGQQQRVALARALARDSRLLLLDEPFSALDETLRATLRRELLRLRAEFGLTVVFVTHDLREAHLLADRIAVFDEGQLLQFGTPFEVFRRPVNRRVAELTGVANIWRGTILERTVDEIRVEVAGLVLRCEPNPALPPTTPGSAVDVIVRAERINMRRDMTQHLGPGNYIDASIVEEAAYGNAHSLRFLPNGPGPGLEVEIAARPYEVLGVRERKRFILEILPEDLHIAPG